jgi:YegS/Rv2252/BmrU family lipid kinase
MTQKRFVVLVNPRGGTRRGIAILDEVRSLFAAAGAELDVQHTACPGHATSLAKTLDLSQCDGLCVIGGDGTIHEVVNGLRQRREPAATPLGLIPAGTGNAVALHLGYTTPREAVQRILAGQTQAVDIARLTMGDQTVDCLNIVGWGVVSDILGTADRLRWVGRARYTVATLWHILFPRRRRARLVLDDRTAEDEFLFVVGCNTQFTGHRMHLAPRADPCDGKIDVIVVRRASFGQMLRLFRRLFDGTHVTLDCVEYHQVRSFRIESQSADMLMLDGELKGRSPAAVEMLPGAIRLFTG